MGYEKKVLAMVVVLVAVYGLSHGGQWAEAAQVHHHVVGEDRGWDISSDVASWASGRTFAVGDFIWFAYSGGFEKDNVVELKSKEEFESCDVKNPIRMYTDGIDKILLQEEGIRYFASSNPETCKKGLKLPVEVKSKSAAEIQLSSSSKKVALAQEPTAPSSSTKICGSIMMIIFGVIFIFLVL